MACNTPLESFRQVLRFFFRLHLNRKSTHKVMGLQNHKSPNFGNFGTPIWKFRDKMPFGCEPCEKAICYKGKGGGFCQVQDVVSFVGLSLPVVRSNSKIALSMH